MKQLQKSQTDIDVKCGTLQNEIDLRKRGMEEQQTNVDGLRERIVQMNTLLMENRETS